MAKSSEKVVGSTAPVMRYRRKVPMAETPPQREDNQTEHRVPERVVEPNDTTEEKAADEKEPAVTVQQEQTPLNPAATRKKKPRAATETVTKDGSAVAIAAAEQTTANVSIQQTAAAPKKKLKKRQLPSNNASVEVEVGAEPVVSREVAVEQPTTEKQTALRKHKQVTNNKHNGQKKERPSSLLKQLLWKAKPVEASAPPSAHTASPATESSVPPLAGPTELSPPAVSPQLKPTKKSKHKRPPPPPPTAEDEDEQEEVEYTVRERQHRKLQASKTVIEKQITPPCSAVDCATALSSQETQSGSDDDDDAATTLLSAYDNLVPHGAIQPKELSAALAVNSFYPTPFPLALTANTELLTQHGITVHEVVLENFACQPPLLRVREGDVVVWKVSGQTLAMVEHSLELSLLHRKPKAKKQQFVKASTPSLASGSAFAWRFARAARVHTACSVYQTKGVVLVETTKPTKDMQQSIHAEQPVTESVSAVPAAAAALEEEAAPPPPAVSKTQKRKEKYLQKKKRAAAVARAQALVAASRRADDDEADTCLDSDASTVYHPPQDLSRSAELDAGVCRAVLSQLEEVAAAVHLASEVIVVGDVECPLVSQTWADRSSSTNNQEEEDEDPTPSLNPAEVMVAIEQMHPDDKPSVLADDWSGTDDDDEDDDEPHALAAAAEEEEEEEENAMDDFQQRIIGMLRRSEETRAQHRLSFQQEQSGFDAGAAYDFFKQRFMQVQEERQIVYSVCPEQQSGSGVGVTDVVSLLSGSSSS